MAHTDKDEPIWLAQNDPSRWIGEDHNCGRRPGDCDIHLTLNATNSYKSCDHIILGDAGGRRWYDKESRDIRRAFYWKPERANTRSKLTAARKAHRADFDPDLDTTVTDQHHHTPYRGGWWH